MRYKGNTTVTATVTLCPLWHNDLWKMLPLYRKTGMVFSCREFFLKIKKALSTRDAYCLVNSTVQR